MIMTVSFKLLMIILIFIAQNANSQVPEIQGSMKQLFKAPNNNEEHNQWISMMRKWRVEQKLKLNYKDDEYKRPEFGWLKNSFIYVQMMVHDRYFYDPIAGQYTVDKFLNNLIEQYGGIDAVLIWPTYPNMGTDNRNQYDMVADMPGGIEGVKKMIWDFKHRGVRVFFPIMIWDYGTREIEDSMSVALVKEMKLIGADGLNGDIMKGVTKDYKDAYDSINYPLVLQPEMGIDDWKMIEWNTSSWGYYNRYLYKPGVSIYKWLEPNHQVFICRRWATNKTDDLQYAFFNGIGYNAWENVWGVYNPISERYKETIRRIATIYRQFAGIWSSSEWEPYKPTIQSGIFATAFPGLDKTVYTFVNRDSVDKSGHQIRMPLQDDFKYFDIWNGVELEPKKRKDSVVFDFNIEAYGYGSLLAIKSYAIDSQLLNFLSQMFRLSSKPLKEYAITWTPLTQQIVDIDKTKRSLRTPSGMVYIPSIDNYLFESNGTMIEGDPLPKAVGVQHPWEEHPSRSQKHIMNIPDFYIDKYPVTNKQFKVFLNATSYRPKDDHNFLRDWNGYNYPKGWDNKPVTWVSIEDARAYAKWAGKRLPHEWEWQYAAQGTQRFLYPWGNEMDSSRIPPADSGRTVRPPTNVNAYPKGASPFGVMDMIGNIWHWTDEYIDEHTRSAILKGSGFYRSATSKWYFPRAYEINKYGKYLLMAPSLDRSATIGFRCVVDK
jgi:gamma-glutamyl hercynylcysteine S-oxide synthase